LTVPPFAGSGFGRADSGTPDPAVQPEYYDGVLWRRTLAYAVDILAIGTLLLILKLLLGIVTVISFGLLSPLWLLLPLVPIAYHTLLIGGPASATLGMQLFGVEVRSWTGSRPSYLQAFVQTAIFYVTVSATASLVLLLAFFSERRRTLHDFLAGTVMVRALPQPFTVFGR
jgi:uncharacterized RDD family membrane protein YckC